AAHARASSALSKVAQLESKFINRKKQLELQNITSGQKPLEEESFSSAYSHEHSAKGKKYLKNRATASGNRAPSNACSQEEESIQNPQNKVMVKHQLVLDSDEEELREMMEHSLEFSSGNEDSKWGAKSKAPILAGVPRPSHKAMSPTEAPKASSFHSKDSRKNYFGGVTSPTPSPAHRNSSVRHNMGSPSLSSFMKDNAVKVPLPGRGNTKLSEASLESDRSEIKSLDELFSKAADDKDSISSSSNDFRLNIRSLDDLAPDISSEAAELKQRGMDVLIPQESNRNPNQDALLVEKDQTSLKTTRAVTGVNDASEGDTEKTVTEAEISEHLSGVSAAASRHRQDSLDHDERTVNSEYSEDFESSLPTSSRESVWKRSEECWESCRSSGRHWSAAAAAPRGRAPQVPLTEAATQTGDPPPACSCSKTNASAVPDPPTGNWYIDPVPITSHIINRDAVEAWTTYSPSALVLNTMLKQHLMLTQQFVENIHHLHLSLVESLENEKFHYHTLEEAKEYIKNHRSPPLTMEQAREEVRRAQEEKLL
ncbi:PREDICTED: uncharacterized protein C19orf44 homolog, partial [Merops nubicus]|uniref:uncharacterized protein C19orf44 homolog n=1 Tax=Merops nubicus TaxID=57421 RepID=UPI0004F06B42